MLSSLLEDFRIVRGDTLRDPRFLEKSGLRKFDVVVANPPFSLKNWGADAWAGDAYGRVACGVPPANSADFAWVQHMVASMNRETGRVGVVMPHGVLFRGGAEKAIRQCLIEQDRLEAVIGLPPNLFYSTTIPACLLIFKTDKPTDRRGTVVFVDGSARFAKGKNQNHMAEADIEAILTAYRSGDDPDGDGGVQVRTVEHHEIQGNDWDLNLGRYVKADEASALSFEDALGELREARGRLRTVEERLETALAAAGYGDLVE